VKRLLLLAFLSTALYAQDKEKKDEPKIVAVAPLEAIAGKTIKLRLRGLKLSDATEVRLGSIAATIKEKKTAEVPTGLEAKDVGDSQVEAEATVPADANGELVCEVVTPAGFARGGAVRVVSEDELALEKEPNNGFREAQAVTAGKLLAGLIKEDKDVDVFSVGIRKGQQFSVKVSAAQLGSLLDPTVSIFDRNGRLLSTEDDDAGRDVKTSVTAREDGEILIAVSDAHDRGGPWHGYELMIREEQP
jgi:hypothetical protein